jgi:hypothetical protein
MENNDVMELLDELFSMVSEAWGVPLGNDKCIIEREKALHLISDIKASLPSSIAEAKRLVAARDEFIGNAKREAEAMRKSAEEKSRLLVDEQEVTRIARTIARGLGLNEDLTGRTVIIVEDIVDTGRTMKQMMESLGTRRPASLHICTLFVKPTKLEEPLDIDYSAFSIPDDFIVGYGLDYDQAGRQLKDVYTIVE